MAFDNSSGLRRDLAHSVAYVPESFGIGDIFRASPESGLEGKLTWSENIDDSFKKSLEQNKPLVILFTNDKCGWCKALDKELQDPNLAKYQGDAVYLKVKVKDNVDDDAKKLYNLMKVEGYPTLSVVRLSQQGGLHETMRNSGYIDSRTIGDKLANALSTRLV